MYAQSFENFVLETSVLLKFAPGISGGMNNLHFGNIYNNSPVSGNVYSKFTYHLPFLEISENFGTMHGKRPRTLQKDCLPRQIHCESKTSQLLLN